MINDPAGSQIRFSRLQGALFSVQVFLRIEQGGRAWVMGAVKPRASRRFQAILSLWKRGAGGTPSGAC